MANRPIIVTSTDKCSVSYLFCHVQLAKQPFPESQIYPLSHVIGLGYSVTQVKPVLQHTWEKKKHYPLITLALKPLENHPSISVTGGEAEQCPFPHVFVDDQDLLQQLVVISRHTSNRLARGSGELPPSPTAAGRDEGGFEMEADAKSPLPPSAGPGALPSPLAPSPAALLTLAYANCIPLGPQMIIIQCNLQLGQFLNYFGNYYTLFCKCLPAKYQIC